MAIFFPSGATRKLSISSWSSCVIACSLLSAIATRHSSENSARSWPFAPSSTKIASSPAFSAAFWASVLARSARKTIEALSFVHSNERMLPLWSVSFDASPPSTGMTQICATASAPSASLAAAAASRVERNATKRPSGDHAGARSFSCARKRRAFEPSASAIQIDGDALVVLPLAELGQRVEDAPPVGRNPRRRQLHEIDHVVDRHRALRLRRRGRCDEQARRAAEKTTRGRSRHAGPPEDARS